MCIHGVVPKVTMVWRCTVCEDIVAMDLSDGMSAGSKKVLLWSGDVVWLVDVGSGRMMMAVAVVVVMVVVGGVT